MQRNDHVSPSTLFFSVILLVLSILVSAPLFAGPPDGKVDVIFGGNGSICQGDGLGGFSCFDVGVKGRIDTVDVGELNGDGRPDILFTNGSFNPSSVCLSNSAGGFDCHAPASDNRQFGGAIGDVDNDGDNDLIFTERVCFNDGAGTFGDASCQRFRNGFDLGVADLNGDGNLDAVLAQRFSRSEVCLGDGAGGFTCSAMPGTNLNDFELSLGDLDGDLDVDAVLGGKEGELCFNDGAGLLSCARVPGLALARDGAVGDVNGDGHPDVVWVLNRNLGVGLATCLGDGSGTVAGFVCTIDLSDSFGGEGIALGDVNGDGFLDAAVWVQLGNNRVCFGDGTGAFNCSTVNDQGGEGGPGGVAIADVTGPDVACLDGDDDGYGDPGNDACPGGPATDCDDTSAQVFPGATEDCNAVDDDCDGTIDEGFDQDGDTYTTCAGDCDDSDPAINPGAEEICDGIDNNCNFEVDEGFDPDGDGLAACFDNCPVDYNPGQEDNEGDGLGDVCDPDDDNDGVLDVDDPAPFEPRITGDFASDLQGLAAFIRDLDLSFFNGPNAKANEGHRNSLANRAEDAAACYAAGDVECAVEKLESLLDKVDGVNPPKDWMDPSPEQQDLADLVALLIQLL